MKKFITVIILFLQLSASAQAQYDDDFEVVITNPQLAALAVLIENYLTKTAPGTVCSMEGLRYECLYKTRNFLVYPKDKTGEFLTDSEEVIGPAFIGLKLNIDVKNTPYNGESSIPVILNEPYWKIYKNAYPLKDPLKYLWVEIAYGYQTDKELVEDVKWIIAKQLESKGLFLY